MTDTETVASVRYFDVFNGDADGICALHQLRMAYPVAATEITGVKRDITLLERLHVSSGDQLTVLDISLDANVTSLHAHLDCGAEVLYFDHHDARQQFTHPHLQLHLSNSPEVCTSILVNEYLQGRYEIWAIVAAYGDHLLNTAQGMAIRAGLTKDERRILQELGTLLNYNAYGETLEDLHIHPAELYREVHQFTSPFDFVHNSSYFLSLQYAYAHERAYLNNLHPVAAGQHSEVYILPDKPWSRRLSGLLANHLCEAHPNKSFAVLTPRRDGTYTVSVRSAEPGLKPASSLCAGFENGGGRSTAAGINQLDSKRINQFFQDFFTYFEDPVARH